MDISPESRERDDRAYRIALSLLPETTSAFVMRMIETGVSPEEFFNMDASELSMRLGLKRTLKFGQMSREEALHKGREEAEFTIKHGIRVISLLDEDYPGLLREIPDAPVVLYKLGNANLDCVHTVSVVGTRRPTNYGINFSRKLVEDLAGYFPDTTIVSGLAFGIDSVAHSASLEHKLPTLAVLAHGLDTIYPSQNRDLAKRIINEGGALLTQYPSRTTPYPQRFLQRNRIVAGISPVTVVAESPVRGGAMSTANLAFNYNREVMALPGRTSDETSGGCNLLIRKEKARLIGCAADLIEVMDWRPLGVKISPRQRNLFPEIEGDNKIIYEILKFKAEPMSLDALHALSTLAIPKIMSILTELEFDGIVTRLPGNRFHIS